MSDESLDVCLIAAEALGRVGDEADVKAALEVLLDFAGHETDYYLRIAAWNALDAMDEKARPVLSELKKVSPKHTGVPSRCGEYIPRLKEKTLRDLE
jgi:HEAT repeat protein